MQETNQPIPRAIAKQELSRINAILEEPHLLIGGLAVQQYYSARNSHDIDLVCSFEIAQSIVNELYPSIDWRILDKKNDDYRPSFQITHRIDNKGTIIFGPKISERAAYDFIDWVQLRIGATPFDSFGETLGNILVPTTTALAYTKFISFLGREAPLEKVIADLNDFIDLTNHDNFSASGYFDLLRRTGRHKELAEAFRIKYEGQAKSHNSSCLEGLSELFVEKRNTIHTENESQNSSINSEQEIISVSNAEEFIQAIGSNRIIEVPVGVLNLSEVKDRYLDHVVWESRFDGYSILIRDVENLTIRTNQGNLATIAVTPRYADVLRFFNCKNISILDINFGHRPEGYCTGGVLNFVECEDVTIERCNLFGCGTVGIELSIVKRFQMSEGSIHDCVNGIAHISSSKGIKFTKGIFYKNREFFGVEIRDSEGIEFTDMRVVDNICEGPLFNIVSSSYVKFVRGMIENNQCDEIGIDVENTVVKIRPIGA